MSSASGAILLFPLLCLAVAAIGRVLGKAQSARGAGLVSGALLLGFVLTYLAGSIALSVMIEGLATGALVFFACVAPVIFGLIRVGDWKVVSALSVWVGPAGLVWFLAAGATMVLVTALVRSKARTVGTNRVTGIGPQLTVLSCAIVLSELAQVTVHSSLTA